MATLVDARVRQERDYGNAGGDEGLRRVESGITGVDEGEGGWVGGWVVG